MSFLCVVVEDLLSALGGELGCECGGLLPARLSVVVPAHLVAPPVSPGDCEPDALLCQQLLESGAVHAAGVCQDRVHLVPERLLEASGGE